MCPSSNRHAEKQVDLDRAFRALSHTSRRRILAALMTDNPRHQPEFETMEFGPPDADQDVITIELHHNHLPHLDEAGFIDWDPDTGRITRGDDFEDIRPLLELIDDHRGELPDDWP